MAEKCGHTAPAATLVVMAAAPAEAHDIIPGVTGFPSRLLHAVSEVETAMCLLGLALLVGQSTHRHAMPLALAWAWVALVAGYLWQPLLLAAPWLWRLPLVVTLGLGGALLSGRAMGGLGIAAAAIGTGTMLGLGLVRDRPGLAGSLEAILAAAVAIALTLVALGIPWRWLTLLSLRRDWGLLPGRIAGAWIVAISLIGLAQSLR